MGHYASEMDPEWGRSIDRTNRKMQFRRKVGEMSLSRFKARDLPMLNRLFSSDNLQREDEKRLEDLTS